MQPTSDLGAHEPQQMMVYRSVELMAPEQFFLFKKFYNCDIESVKTPKKKNQVQLLLIFGCK